MTNFQRLESTTIGVHMRCIKISEKGKVKKWGKSTKIRNNILKNFQRLELGEGKKIGQECQNLGQL